MLCVAITGVSVSRIADTRIMTPVDKDAIIPIAICPVRCKFNSDPIHTFFNPIPFQSSCNKICVLNFILKIMIKINNPLYIIKFQRELYNYRVNLSELDDKSFLDEKKNLLIKYIKCLKGGQCESIISNTLSSTWGYRISVYRILSLAKKL